MEVQKRKLKSMLHISGLAFMVLGLWSALKGIVDVFLDYRSAIDAEVRNAMAWDPTFTESDLKMISSIVIFFLIALIVLILLLFHFLIGREAMKEAKGKMKVKGKSQRKGIAYLVLSIIYIIITIISIVMNFLDPSGLSIEEIAEMFFDATMIFALVMIVKSAIQLRKIEREERAALAA